MSCSSTGEQLVDLDSDCQSINRPLAMVDESATLFVASRDTVQMLQGLLGSILQNAELIHGKTPVSSKDQLCSATVLDNDNDIIEISQAPKVLHNDYQQAAGVYQNDYRQFMLTHQRPASNGRASEFYPLPSHNSLRPAVASRFIGISVEDVGEIEDNNALAEKYDRDIDVINGDSSSNADDAEPTVNHHKPLAALSIAAEFAADDYDYVHYPNETELVYQEEEMPACNFVSTVSDSECVLIDSDEN